MKTYVKLTRKQVDLIVTALVESKRVSVNKLADKIASSFPNGVPPCDMELIGMDEYELSNRKYAKLSKQKGKQ